MKAFVSVASSAVIAAVAVTAPAEPLPTQRYLPLAVAIEAALAALKAGIEKIKDRLTP